jgi:hypothetical protein
MEDSDNLLPMGVAIAQVKPDQIYREAKRQYEALVRLRDAQNEASPSTPSHLPQGHDRFEKMYRTRAQQRMDLCQHYRDIFEDATSILDDLEKNLLLTICFAYKTRTGALAFLDLVDERKYPWVPLLKGVVTERSRDTVFAEDVALGLDPEGELKTMDPHEPYGLRSKTAVARVTPTNVKGPYFVITTLPLAFPEKFFVALASHAPIHVLEPSLILSHPSAMQLAHSDDLASSLRTQIPDFWKADHPPSALERYSVARQRADDEASWTAFFDHLLDTRTTLTLTLPKGQAFLMEEGESGYSEEDLSLWLAAWRAERQNVGMKEKGAAVRMKKKFGLGGRKGVDGKQAEAMDAPRRTTSLSIVDKRRKRVAWHDGELTYVEDALSKRQKK